MATLKEKILNKIKKADNAYYNEDNPIMTDAEYDNLRDGYIKLYDGKEDLNYVPGDTNTGFKHFVHTSPVISLDKIKSNEKERLEEAIKKLWPVVLEPKLDGLTVVAYPNKDGSCFYVTRGSGTEGDILPNFISEYEIKGVNDSFYPIRGEVYLSQENFSMINYEREIKGLPLFANPRNAAAGILRNKERSPYIDSLKYVCYDVLGVDWPEIDKINYIKEHTKFEPVSVYEYDTIENTIEGINYIYNDYKSLELAPIDGIVIKTNQKNSLSKYGMTGHHPNNAYAWKIEQTGVITTLKDVEWQVGRKYITPVAILEPIEIDGSIVSKASVHNPAIIRKLNLHKEDKVKLIKANEIIPQIIEVAETFDGDEIDIPTSCPCCNSNLESDNDKLYCPNNKCQEKISQALSYIGSKKILDIEGLSIETCRKIAKKFYEKIKEHPLAILTLKYEDLIQLEGFAKKSSSNLFKAIQKAQETITLDKYIASLGFPGIGITVGTALMKTGKTFGGVLKLLHNKNNLLEIEGIEKVVSDTLSSSDFINTYNDCFSYFNKIEEYVETQDKNNPDKIMSFALTGTMSMPRTFYESLIESAGHKIAKSVSKKTDYLVIADINSQSSKAKKARELGIKLISPEDLTSILSR
jgi:DNA ligase (NAD+)